MHEAINNSYPQLKPIATTGGYQGGAAASTSSGTTPDVVDDPYDEPSAWFDQNATRYDRSGPQVLIGEYGAQHGRPTRRCARRSARRRSSPRWSATWART